MTLTSPAVRLATPWQQHSRPTEGLRLRVATEADVFDLAALKRRVEAQTYAHLGTPESLAVRLRERCSAWYLLSRIGEGDLLLAAELGGHLIGMAGAGIEGEPAPTLRLHSAYVEQRGYGAGRALTAARLEAAHRLGIEQVVADCFVGVGAATRRLAQLGLRDTGERRACPSFPGARVARWAGSVQTALNTGAA